MAVIDAPAHRVALDNLDTHLERSCDGVLSGCWFVRGLTVIAECGGG